MKFLVDAQLPPRLASWLTARGQEATHVSEWPGGLTSPDQQIWDAARSSGQVIVTKDKDFLDLAAVRGTPPQVWHIGLGNASTARLLLAVEAAWPLLQRELASSDVAVVMQEAGRLAVLRRG